MFSLLNSFSSWLGTTLFPFRFAVDSQLQQHLSPAHILDSIKQKAVIGEPKQLGLTKCFARSSNNLELSISVLVFSDAGRPSDGPQISTICGLSPESLDQNS